MGVRKDAEPVTHFKWYFIGKFRVVNYARVVCFLDQLRVDMFAISTKIGLLMEMISSLSRPASNTDTSGGGDFIR